ncbi:hypothetical protein [Ancylobacter pratisalsi]|uniref:DUF3035 domain-containing protein n=1 Tax=Ancylobacter pratisalsi TaxID=1745854 RepID=A0A6P1YID5_9HYPH|nr:hypothetical protein [Ancylobacter pratisalsi]QIB32456.1 hypothetical protein G3A50_01120 [Ancylobacter pratisalsi]
MGDEREMKPNRRKEVVAGRANGLFALGLALLLGGCAGGGLTSGLSDESLAQAIGAAPKSEATAPAATGPYKELPYPNFGAPKQVGDRPVMTPAETEQMQSDLEGLAKEREQKMLKELEQSQ